MRVGADLIGEVDKMTTDGENFAKNCFCDVNERVIYGEVQGCEFNLADEEWNLSIRQVKAGLSQISHSRLP